jgi:cell surface protein SprA
LANKQHTHFGYKLLAFVIIIIALAQVFTARGFDPFFDPPPPPPPVDTPELHFPIQQEQQIDPSSSAQPAPAINLQDPANIKKTVDYDPIDNLYRLGEQVGGQDIKNPTTLTPEEYLKIKGQQDETDYWRQRLDALSMFNQKPAFPDMTKDGVFDRLFGSNKISVKPQGNLDLTFGGNWQNMKNPNLTQRAQKYGIFDFDMQMNVNLLAQIGDKLKLNISNNTQPSFGEQNLQKLEYTGKEDDIIKKIEAGTVSFPLKSNLLTGPLSLFGLKTQLQFGKLFVTGVLSQQKSQRKSINLQGGAQTQSFTIKADAYDENKNFLLGQYFYNTYDKTLENFPVIATNVIMNRVDVWITNRTGATTNVRSTINFMDLGEQTPFQPTLNDPSSKTAKSGLPDNASNRLYKLLLQNPGLRNQGSGTTNGLISIGLDSSQGRDYTVATMRRLNTSEYTFSPQLGYISLNTQVNADDIVGVAYRYTYNGTIYQVGEFPEDVSPDTSSSKVMFLKMLKGVSASPKLPVWNLMMKNIYSVGGGNISKTNFKLNVMYQDPGGGQKRYLPEGPKAGVPLITLLNLDRLDAQNDPFPDGVFDYVEGITVNSQAGKIIFPTLQPFGNDLAPALGGDPILDKRYLYQILYDSTKTIALQFQQNDRFLLQGNYQGASGSEVSLGGYNIPQGSVTVTAGGQRLSENVDYQVDYSRGTVKILNQGILASGVPINISFEDNASFGLVQQSFWGMRFDYYSSPKLTLGGTLMRLTERPFTTVVNYGDDPIKNTVAGLDANYQSEFPWLTKALDKLPIYSTTAPSLISLRGEVAGIFPGHQRFINSLDPEGSVSIDNFEGANSSIDLRFPATSWSLASTPSSIINANNNTDLTSNYNRAKLAWYMLEPTLIDPSSAPDNIKADTGMQDYWRLVQQTEVFPDKSCITGQCGLQTFDLGYYPKTRGPYNYNSSPAEIDANGNFINPITKWGGIQRALDNNSSDFEAQNVEYIDFWALDPFIYNNNNSGDLYINLGNVSEDILKDSRMSFENGIPSPKTLDKLDETQWGYVPKLQQQITHSFDNDPNVRAIQDVGYDELDDTEEKAKFGAFVSAMGNIPGITQAALAKIQNDPSSDNFHNYRGDDYDKATSKNGLAFQRYIDYNNPSGNSPVADLNSQYTTSGTSIPESEDIDRDNALNETEAYYSYRVHLAPSTDPSMSEGQNFIVNKKVTAVKLGNGRTQNETWYQFKIPVSQFEKAVGGISDFRSIRFVRMYMTGFKDTTVVRFAQLQLDRDQWRQYLYSLSSPGENIPKENLNTTSFALTAVSLEQSADRAPIPYVLPPGVQRQLTPATTGQTLQQDEQSLSLQICGLEDGDSRAVFKEQTLDMRQYKTIRMFIHAESQVNQSPARNGDLQAIIRIGSDFINNYYEYRIPLTITSPLTTDPTQIWPATNNVDFQLAEFTTLKTQRDAANYPSYLPYSTVDAKGNTLVVVGSPNFGEVKDLMLGVMNPKKTTQNPTDDGMRKCAEVWFDELRLVDPDETPGYAASGQADIQLADLGSVHLDANMHTSGYGNIDQKVDQRFKDNLYAYDATSNLNLGKLMPKSFGLQLPVFAGYSQTLSNPKYDPYDQDLLFTDKIKAGQTASERDSIKKAGQTFSSVTSFNLANIRYLGNPEAKPTVIMPWSLRNFDANYSFNRTFKRNPLLDKDELVDQKLGLGYSYAIKTKYIEPFKKMIKSKSKWLTPIKDLNFNLLPSSFSFRTNLHRIVDETDVRNIDGGPYDIPATFFKNFTWDRTYNLRWELTRSLSFNYSADNQSRIDEPYGKIDTKEKRDSLLKAISRLGRNTYFTQALSATYTLPTQKFPFLDWTRATATYSSTYSYTAASILAYTQGNTIANTQQKQFNGELNFVQLYNKSRYLKAINAPPETKSKAAVSLPKGASKKSPGGVGTKGGFAGKPDKSSGVAGQDAPDDNAGLSPKEIRQKRREAQELLKQQSQLPPRPTKKQVDKSKIPWADTMSAAQLGDIMDSLKAVNKKAYKKDLAAWRLKRKNTTPYVSDGVKFGGRLLTMLKRVNLNYSETGGTILPGFMDSTQFLGVNSRSGDGWYDFAFGGQPDRAWFDKQAAMQRISRDTLFNGQLQQTYTQNYTVQATLEPIQNLRIDLTWNKQFNKNYSETFKFNNDPSVNDYEHYNPYSMGTYSISFIALKTMFRPSSANSLSPTYLEFINNGPIISKRLGAANPYVAGAPDPVDPTYDKGYTKYSQDVLIPAFLAAYSGRDVKKVPLVNNDDGNIKTNPFQSYFPLPNWKLTYNGLAKLPFFSEYLSNFTLTHAYIGTMSMNNFLSSFYYEDKLAVGYPSFIDSTSHNFVPFFTVPNITITENLGPFLGFEAAFKNGVNISVKYNRTRMVSLSLVDYQVSESKSSEIVVGGGARIKGLVLPFPLFGARRLKNDLNFNVSVGYRNDLTSNSYLAQSTNIPTQGQKVISISPTLDYIVNDFLQLRFFYDRRQSVPVLSTSYPITTTRAGITLRFLFAPQ